MTGLGFQVHSFEFEALDMARKQLVSQKEDLRHLRGQAAICAALCGLQGTFFAQVSRIAEKNVLQCENWCSFGVNAWLVLIFSLFFLSMMMVVAVVTGWRTCTFELSPERFRHAAKYREDPKEMLEAVTIDAERFLMENEDVLADVRLKLMLGFVCVWLQVPFWLLFIFTE